jgi:high-affinity Fe2+/Pb2+ permease
VNVSRLELWIGAVVAALLATAPSVAVACSVCSAGRDDETRAAFLATTGLLSFLPLVLIGGLVWWLRRRARELERAASLDALSRTSSSQ